ncbi:MAG TPA: hypothetical protein VKM54_04380 [Myxococcota bacterium]|nr:hypothetical protein [Myxococcota bacterium]
MRSRRTVRSALQRRWPLGVIAVFVLVIALSATADLQIKITSSMPLGLCCEVTPRLERGVLSESSERLAKAEDRHVEEIRRKREARLRQRGAEKRAWTNHRCSAQGAHRLDLTSAERVGPSAGSASHRRGADRPGIALSGRRSLGPIC